jgi:4-hydroxybutyrate dehydrogenase
MVNTEVLGNHWEHLVIVLERKNRSSVMKLFQEKPQVQKFLSAAAFVKEYGIGKGDFILASKSIYDAYFEGLCEGAEVRFKTDYGKSEPTDIMLDALLSDFRKLDCNRIFAIGGGAVIDMAKILVLDSDAKCADIYQRKVEKCWMKQDLRIVK